MQTGSNGSDRDEKLDDEARHGSMTEGMVPNEDMVPVESTLLNRDREATPSVAWMPAAVAERKGLEVCDGTED